MNKQKHRLLDGLRETLRMKHNSLKTEKSYIHWIRRFIYFHHMRHPQEMGAGEVKSYLNHLAVDQHVTASIHNTYGDNILSNFILGLFDKVLRLQNKCKRFCLLRRPPDTNGVPFVHIPNYGDQRGQNILIFSKVNRGDCTQGIDSDPVRINSKSKTRPHIISSCLFSFLR